MALTPLAFFNVDISCALYHWSSENWGHTVCPYLQCWQRHVTGVCLHAKLRDWAQAEVLTSETNWIKNSLQPPNSRHMQVGCLPLFCWFGSLPVERRKCCSSQSEKQTRWPCSWTQPHDCKINKSIQFLLATSRFCLGPLDNKWRTFTQVLAALHWEFSWPDPDKQRYLDVHETQLQ